MVACYCRNMNNVHLGSLPSPSPELFIDTIPFEEEAPENKIKRPYEEYLTLKQCIFPLIYR